MKTTQPILGTAIFEQSLLDITKRLWEGPLSPYHIPHIEKTLRAFLITPKLLLSRFNGIYPNIEAPSRTAIDYRQPFNDHLLDYEFQNPREPHDCTSLATEESSFLSQLAQKEIIERALAIIPTWARTEGEAFTFLEEWYFGTPVEDIFPGLVDDIYDSVAGVPFDRNQSIYKFPLLHSLPSEHANYMVGSHRAGMTVHGASPLSTICMEHIFSKWPEYLYHHLSEEFKRDSELLRGPGIGVSLPPLTALVMSRAERRTKIPETIRDLREEYADRRTGLWALLSAMWNAPSFKEQLDILRLLESAANSIFAAAFPARFDVLSVAISATDLVGLSPSGILSSIRDRGQARSRVLAVSFAEKLSRDLRRHLLPTGTILRRHLTEAELIEFGTSLSPLI